MINSQNTKDDYNSEPVFYCKNCLSLRVMVLDDNEYCDECGCTEMESSSIEDWQKLYNKKYNK